MIVLITEHGSDAITLPSSGPAPAGTDHGQPAAGLLEQTHAFTSALSRMILDLGNADQFGRYLLGMAEQHFRERLGRPS